jgi:AcrR family transcriptional regulator
MYHCGMPDNHHAQRQLRKDAQENLERILRAATELLVERGPSVPMEAIAARAGVGKGTLYRRFKSREAMLAAVAEREVDRLELLAEMAARPASWASLSTFVQQAVASPVTNPELRQILLSAMPREAARTRWQSALIPAYRLLVEAAQGSGEVRLELEPTDLPLLVMAIAAVARQTGGPHSSAVRRVLAIVMAGVGSGDHGTLSAAPIEEDRLAKMLLSSPQNTV